ncbi:neuraminidase-like domain-containing protein [Moorena sp. SIO3I6]|uniref:Tc toxin subunit A-related protein n=1 Tax=Moorena sp. SIO3I6 TaxID=2607831 RepID=UPI0013F84761|nr:neuraminidase-like domain-containing protein [Moorena sp. SIO3I6]NEP22626.1 hypothetical protein [Moorena sp. SIO3I6]
MSDLTAIKNNETLKPFFDRHPEFDLKTFNFFDRDAVTALNWEGLEQEPISHRLKGYQRLLRLGVEPENAVQLCASEQKLDSALAIASRSQTNFIQASNLDPETARSIHRNATQKTKGLLVLLANVIQFSSPREATTLFNNTAELETSLQTLPSYQELFGSLDYLQCEHCQSIFSPGAYLVDLLRIVDEYITQIPENTIPTGLSLNERRPDLQDIPLTCDNTNDTIPYVQIVSEVLEARLQEDSDLSGEPYKDLAQANYPQSLPFNAYLEQNRIYLNYLNLTSAEIYPVFHPQTPRDSVWAREYISFSPEAYQLIITSNITEESIAERYGVSGAPGANFWGLTDKDTFLQQTQLSVQDLDSLLYQNLSQDEIDASVAAQFYINKDLSGSYLNLSNTGDIENLGFGPLDCVDRFLRLAHKLGWSFDDLDWAIASIEAGDIDENATQNIAKIKELQAWTALPLDVLCSFWYDMKTIGKGDKPERPQDLFDRIFNNPFTVQGQEPFDPNSSTSWDISDSVLTNRLIAALQLSNDQLIKIAKGIWGDTSPINLNLANLSRLFRTSQMLKLVKLTVDEYQLLLQILGKSFQNLDTIAIDELYEILEFSQWLKASGFNVYELDYILTGTEYTDVDIFLREEDMQASMESLWQKVQLPPERNELHLPAKKQQLDNKLNQEIADHFGMDPNLFAILAPLGAESVGSDDYIALLLTPVTIPGTEWDKIVGCLKYISRMDLLVDKLDLTVIELEKIQADPAAYNISSLTAPSIEDVQSLYRFKKEFLNSFNQPEDNLLKYLANPTVAALAELTGWELDQINAAITYLNDGQLEQSVAGILKLKKCFDLCVILGCTIDFLCEFCKLLTDGTVANNWNDGTGLTYQNIAQSITNFVKAKYDNSQWADIYGQLNGEWQESKCKVLTDFAVWKLEMEDSRQLSEYILLDVETTSCSCNSYIQLATLSVQTYLQRCRMGIEQGVTQVDISPTWWDWLMNYRNWEVNRKVFLYPENYIDPNLRPDVSPLFKELQDQLLQSDVTAAAVEEAYTNYFDALYELSKLQIIDGCYYPVKSPKSEEPIQTLFLVAKTVTDPPTFYYRSCEQATVNKPVWGYWQEIELQIDSDYVAPIYAFDRLFIFWVELQETDGRTEELAENGETGQLTKKRVVKYSFLNSNQKWVAAQTLVENATNSDDESGDIPDTFYDQVYPLVDFISEKPDVQLINVWFGGLSGTPVSEFNTNLDTLIAGLEPLAKIASDLLPVLGFEPQNLSEARSNLAAATVSNLAIFAGGEKDKSSRSSSKIVDVFQYQADGSLIKLDSNGLELSQERTNLAGATVGNLVIFAGGYNYQNNLYSDNVDVFRDDDGTLTEVTGHGLTLSEPRSYLVAATVGNLVIFAGGQNDRGLASTTIDIFRYDDGTETLTPVTGHGLTLSEPRKYFAGATVGNLVIFAGSSSSDAVDVFRDDDGTLTEVTGHGLTLSQARSFLAAATVGNLAIFAGGVDSQVVDVFRDDDGTLTEVTGHGLTLSESRQSLAGATVGNLVVFAGGKSPGAYYNAIDVFQYQNLDGGTLIDVSNPGLKLSQTRSNLAATAVGNVILLAGGNDLERTTVGKYYDIVDIFNLLRPEINPLPDLDLSVNTTVSPIKSESAGFVLQDRSKATAFYDLDGHDNDISKRLTTDLIQQLSQKLFAKGFDGLLSLESQQLNEPDFPLIPSSPLDFDGAYGPYFWEIFFHIPFLIASTLNTHQSYDSARLWYQYIFNPTISGQTTDSDRYWRFLPFRGQNLETLEDILTNEATIQAYQENPYDPHAIARMRIGAYQKAVVMKYIDNLIDWADALFIQDNWEAINQATTLYLLAYDLLGPKPKNLGKPPTPPPITFAEIQAGAGGTIPEFLIDLENYPQYADFLEEFNEYVSQFDDMPFNVLDAYFCVSENAEFAQYWDRIEDRLYKIRHCQNIQGIERQLALFSPVIDPMQMVSQTASGDSSLTLFTADTVPHYRFSYLLDRAKGMTNTVIQLGSTLLATLEKKDAEALALLQASQQPILLQLITKTKEKQIEDARATLDALEKSLGAAQYRLQYYQNLLASGLSSGETATIDLMTRSIISYTLSKALEGTAIAAYLLPSIFGTSNGGMNFGEATNTSAVIAQTSAEIRNQQSTLASTNAQFQRRAQDWEFQEQMAEWDTEQIAMEIEAASIRVEAAQADLDAHNKSVEQSLEIEQFLQDKFTNQQLYQWMLGQLSNLYFQTYKLALEMAAAVQKAYQYELNTNKTFIQPTYWNSNKQGLLAGESLMLSLDQLEKAYFDGNKRTLEIEKIISLRQLDPYAFMELKTNGSCILNFDEKLFALDFPSHYCRQIKTISVSIPAVVGPYQNINATLTQTSSKVLMEPDPDGVSWLLTPQGNPPNSIRQNWRQDQQIAISRGANDNGLFVLNFQDERYLPFEGTGAISHWTLEMPKATNPIDFETITDVIITLSYTALNGDKEEGFTEAVTSAIQKFTGSLTLNLRQQLLQNSDPNSLSFLVSPQLFRGNLANYTITKVYLRIFEADDSTLIFPYSLNLTVPEESPIPLALEENQDIISATSDLTIDYDLSAQTWSLEDSNSRGFFDLQNLSDIVLVVEYEGGITWPQSGGD